MTHDLKSSNNDMTIDINKSSIIRHDVCEAASRGNMVVDLGCGKRKVPGSIGIDHCQNIGVDIIVDMESCKLPLPSSSVDIVWADQLVEHIRNLIPLMAEIQRILKPGGQFIAKTPYFRSAYAVVDPTHVRSFSIMSMDYYCESKYLFKQYGFFSPGFSSLQIRLDSDFSKFANQLMCLAARRAIANPSSFENSPLSFMFPFSSITYSLIK